MKPMTQVLAVILSAAILGACTAERDVTVADTSKKELPVIAYHFGDTENIRQYAIEDLSQIIYSFLKLNGNQLAIETDQQRTDILNLVSLKEDHPDLKVLVALGGWGGCETCSQVFASAAGRSEFAASVKAMMVAHDLDGLDLDWEYPAIEGFPGHQFLPEDRQNFTALVRELRDAMGTEYELSFAAGGIPKFMDNSVEWNEVMPLVDRVNLMTYDLVSGNSTVTGHHTALYSSESQTASADQAVRYLVELGVPVEKIVIGAAFYARVFENVDADDGNPLHRPASFKDYVGYQNFESYFDGDFSMLWDDEAQAPYAYSATRGLFATFDDQRSVSLKTKYAADNRLGGIMFWQLAEDSYDNGLLKAIVAAKAAGNGD